MLIMSTANAQSTTDWTIHVADAGARRILGTDVVAVVGSPENELFQINVSKLKAPAKMPRTEQEWQDFVVEHMKQGHGHVAVKKALLNSPHVAYIAEISYNLLGQAMMAKILVIVENGVLLQFRYDDTPTAYLERNTKFYRPLFQDLAFGHRDDLVRQILNINESSSQKI